LEATPLKNSHLKIRFMFAAKSLKIEQQRLGGAFKNEISAKN